VEIYKNWSDVVVVSSPRDQTSCSILNLQLTPKLTAVLKLCGDIASTGSLVTVQNVVVIVLTRSMPGQFFHQVGFSFADVPAGYRLWCRCAELHVYSSLAPDNFNSSVAVNMFSQLTVFCVQNTLQVRSSFQTGWACAAL